MAALMGHSRVDPGSDEPYWSIHEFGRARPVLSVPSPVLLTGTFEPLVSS
jgi:hypothetical protein